MRGQRWSDLVGEIVLLLDGGQPGAVVWKRSPASNKEISRADQGAGRADDRYLRGYCRRCLVWWLLPVLLGDQPGSDGDQRGTGPGPDPAAHPIDLPDE